MKVLLADDHTLFREGLRLVLEGLVSDPIEIVEAADFSEALGILRNIPEIDIGLVDLGMPGMDGFTAIQLIRRTAPDLFLVVVSANENPADIRRALDCGAHGYITKSSSSAAMVAGIRSVLDGDTFISPDIPLPAPQTGNEAKSLESLLTPRQRDVLAMLRQGKSNKEIARDLNLAEITVKLHVTAILRALGVDNRTQAAILAAKMDA